VSGGQRSDNCGNAVIGTANVVGTGGGWTVLHNSSNATIGTANISMLGQLDNYGNATVGTANVAAGVLNNNGDATICTANVNYGCRLSPHPPYLTTHCTSWAMPLFKHRIST